MGRSSAGQDRGRRERIAAQRAAKQRARQRNRLFIAGGAIVVVVAVVLAIVLLHGSGGGGSASGSGSPGPTGASLDQLTAQVTSVPAAVLDQVGGGQVTAVPTAITGGPLTSDGKPEVVYIGAEYCPYCAAERWSLIVALSRFGTFTGLATTRSAARSGAGSAEPYPNTPTFTFANASYSSGFLAFSPVEEFTNVPDPSTGGYTRLQTPTAEQQALIEKYDAANSGAIPFTDFGNRFMSVGASYDPGVLQGLTWSQIAADLRDPASRVGKSVLGAANYVTAALCKLTGDKPATACTTAVQALQARI
jgi:thiol-disulfide isomerase/thioredoxin